MQNLDMGNLLRELEFSLCPKEVGAIASIRTCALVYTSEIALI